MIRNQRPVKRARTRHAFSLVELVIVVTIIGMLASIAVPRVVNASSGANEAALQATLANVRKSIDVYYAEHGKYPGYNHTTGLPDNDAFVDQLLMYSDDAGKTNATYSTTYKYGPYLRAPFPTNSINNLATVHVKATPGDANPADGSVGWIAVLSHGYFGIHATDAELDDIGVKDAVTKSALKGGVNPAS
jgi:prepilin-type N-terminal cleavage/methylation domain-containing protein